MVNRRKKYKKRRISNSTVRYSDSDKIRNAWGIVYDVDKEMPPFYLTDQKGTFWLSGKGELYQKNNAPFVDYIKNDKLFKIKQEQIEGWKDISITIEPIEKGDVYVDGFCLTEKEEIRNGQCSITSKRFKFWLRFEAFLDVKERPELASIGSNYRFINLLGQGGFAIVYKGLNINEETFCAIKTARHFDRNPELGLEKSILSNVYHANIVKFLGFIQVHKDQFLITEFVGGGSLEYRLKCEGVITEPFAKHIFSQLFSAVAYLHHRKILHRDLKPQNIVLTASDDATCVPKVIDFGLACYADEEEGKVKRIVGSKKYMAPEIVTRKVKRSSAYYTEKVDVWGLGICLFVALNQCTPIPFDEDPKKHRQTMMLGKANFVSLESYQNLSQSTKFILERCLQVNEVKRASISDLLEYQWTIANNPVVKL